VDTKSHDKYVAAWDSADRGAYFRAIELINEAIGLSPDESVLWVTKAQFLADVNELQAAITSAKKAMELNSQNYHAPILLGLVYKREGNVDQSIKHYKQALRLKTDYVTLTLLALAELERYPNEAIAHATEALRLNPEWDEAHDVLCRAKSLV
jgi:protein O-GlcNAc transferase